MGLRPGYRQTDVGMIPEDWEVIRLGDIARIYQPITISSRQMKKAGFPVYGANGIIGFFDKFNHDKWQSIITCRGSTCGTVNRTVDKSWITGNAMVINVDGNEYISKDFLFHLLNFQDFADCITGTGQPQIVRGPLFGLKLRLPSLRAEQHAIAAALSDVDAALAGLGRLVAKKRDLKQAAMQQLLTGQTRLPGFTGNWEVKRLGDHVSFLRNGVHSRNQLTTNDPVRYLHYGDIHLATNMRLDPGSAPMPRLPSATAMRLSKLNVGDVVFVDASEDLVGVGKSVEITGDASVEIVAGQHTIAARFDKRILADGFKGYLQFLPVFGNHIRRLAAGTKVYATNRKHIASAEIELPGPDEQVAIAAVLSDMDTGIEALEAQREKMRMMKQAMMQALLTGRVRLPIPQDMANGAEPAAAHG